MTPAGVAAGFRQPASEWTPAAGGFGGLPVFIGRTLGVPVAVLKAHADVARLTRVHGWISRAAGTGLQPDIFPTKSGGTILEAGGYAWDCVRFVAGEPDSRESPGVARVANGCAALAALHRAWPPEGGAVFPAVGRMLAVLHAGPPLPLGEGLGEGLRLIQPNPPAPFPKREGGARPDAGPPLPLGEGLGEGLASRKQRAGGGVDFSAAARARLAPFAGMRIPVRPCLCDVHHDHVLFRPGSDEVAGIIDPANMKLDHPAVDLARYLGDADADIPAGVAAYLAAGGCGSVTPELVEALAFAGAACAIIGWADTLGGRPAPPAVAARLARMARRLTAGSG